MTNLYLHGNPVRSIFELLGTNENDVTYSFGWVLSRCPTFLNGFLDCLAADVTLNEVAAIRLQQHGADRGYTDVEIIGSAGRLVVEAKRGWSLPDEQQLRRYVERIGSPGGALLVLSECSTDYARPPRLPASVQGVPVLHRSWRDVADLVEAAVRDSSGLGEKSTLREFGTYMKQIVRSQNKTSNMVYVLALASDTPEWSRISWIDIVEKKQHYFHPFASSGWPVEPPNYLAFRYSGRLQSIHHVERAEVVADVHEFIPEIQPGAVTDHVLYWLGRPFHPGHTVPTGPKIVRAARRYAALDLLLTSSTITEACELTRARSAEAK